MRSAIIAELTLTQSTLATRRNVQKLLASTDLAEASRVAIQNVSLAVNDQIGNAAEAEIVLGTVPNFLHIAVTAPVRLIFFYEIGESGYFDVTRHFTLTGALSNVTIRNRSLTEVVQARIISA